MEQLGIDFNQAPRARTSNAATSHAAAARVREFDGEHYAKILEALKRPGTIHEIAERCGLDPVQVARRLSELEKALPPRALPTDETRPSPRGRPCRVWARR
jgi:predicted ArsR family transcriptional regulator